MKKLLAVLIMLAMVISFSACGTNVPITDEKNVTENSETITDNTETDVEADYTESDVESEENNADEIPEGWEAVDIAYLPEELSAYFDPEVLNYVELSGGFSNAKGTDSMVVSIDIIETPTIEDYLKQEYDSLVADTMNSTQNVVLGEVETSTCAGYTIYSATIFYDAKSYDLSENFDKTKEYTPEEMDEHFPVIWTAESLDIELVEISDGVYMETNVIVGELETFLGGILFKIAQ